MLPFRLRRRQRLRIFNYQFPESTFPPVSASVSRLFGSDSFRLRIILSFFIFHTFSVAVEEPEQDLEKVPSVPVGLAVINLMNKGLSYDEAITISENLRQGFLGLEEFEVMSTDVMEKVLLDQHFEQEGCFSRLCLWEIGRILNVDRVVGGVARKIENNIISLSLRMVESDSGATIHAGKYEYEMKQDTILQDSVLSMKMHDFAWSLVGKEPMENRTAFSNGDSLFVPDSMVITVGRIPVMFNLVDRNLEIIQRDEIGTAPVNTVDELLEYIPGVNVMKRGSYGVQSDVTIWGSTEEQVLVLVDGIKMTDPQTGHYMLDLPVTNVEVERIEVLKGPGSRMWGPDAFGGAINIITKIPTERITTVDLSYGKYSLSDVLVSSSFPMGKRFNQNFSIESRRSSGFDNNSDFGITSVNYRSSLVFERGQGNMMLGYVDKKFGAYRYYSLELAEEREHTTTTFMSLRGKLLFGTVKISSGSYWRRHSDDLMFVRNDPDSLRKTVTSDVFGFDVLSVLDTRFGSFSVGVEFVRDLMEKSGSGSYSRSKAGLFIEYANKLFNRISIAGGVNGYYVGGGFGWNVIPGFDFGYAVTDHIKIFGAINRSFRIPTFTELYYEDSFRIGSSSLRVERGITYEMGTRWLNPLFMGKVAVFHRTGSDFIDWARQTEDSLWVAGNGDNVNTTGAECIVNIHLKKPPMWFPLTGVRMGYTVLKVSGKEEEFDSLYTPVYFTNQVVLDIRHRLPFGFSPAWILRYEESYQSKGRLLLDFRLEKTVKWITVYFNITNLSDVEYEDIASIPMPGRWWRAGISAIF